MSRIGHHVRVHVGARRGARTLRAVVTEVLLEHAADQYVPAEFAAHVTGRPERTIRTWVHAGLIRARRVDHLLVHLGDAVAESATRGRRRRLRGE